MPTTNRTCPRLPPEALLLQRHLELLRFEARVALANRVLGVALVVVAPFAWRLGQPGLFGVAATAVLLASLSFLTLRLTVERRTSLEDLIIQEFGRSSEAAWVKRVYSEWQLHSWKHPLVYALLRVEPLLWALLTLAECAALLVSPTAS